MNVINHTAASPGASFRSLRERVRAVFRSRSDEGQSLVEFALAAPILLVIVTGITAFGLALNNYLSMTNAISTSAQYLAVSRANTTDPCSLAATAFANAAPNLNSTKLNFTFVLNGTSYGSYSGLSASTCSSSSTTTGAAGNLVAGQSAKMTVTYPCNLSVYGKNYLPSCNLVVQTVEIVQ
jgi:Flp pilus assembly protein TadG